MNQPISSKSLPGFSSIVQITCRASDLIDSGYFTWWSDQEGVRLNPDRVYYLYEFDGMFGGGIHGELADFETLCEFADSVKEGFEQLYYEFLNADIYWGTEGKRFPTLPTRRRLIGEPSPYDDEDDSNESWH